MTMDREVRAATEQFERQLIKHAQRGDEEAGREILYTIALAIDAGRFDSPLFPFLADCLILFARDGVPLERALCVERDRNPGGKPSKYDSTELAAVDILLRDHAGFSPEQAVTWIKENIGADRRTVQKRRPDYDGRYNPGSGPLMESLDRETLLHRSGSLRKTVAQALSQRENSP